jgi:hypothetical protein
MQDGEAETDETGANEGDRQESHTLRGPVDRAALITIRDEFESREPLSTPGLDDFVNPTVLEVGLDDGLLDADSARIDVRWTTRGDYKFHYTDPTGQNLRWGNHPHDGDYVRVSGTEHYHPPPDASSNPKVVETSCIEQSPEKLVTWAVLKLWRTAYHRESLDALNSATNPP